MPEKKKKLKKFITLKLKFHPHLREDTKRFEKESGVLPSPTSEEDWRQAQDSQDWVLGDLNKARFQKA